MIFNEEWYSVEDMSKITKIDVQGIRRDIRLGLITNIKMEKNKYYIHRDVVSVMFEEQEKLKDYYTTKEAAEILGKSYGAVGTMITRNTIKTAIRHRNLTYIRKDEIDAFKEYFIGTINREKAAKKYGLIGADLTYILENDLVKAKRLNDKWYINEESLDKFIDNVKHEFDLCKSSDITRRHIEGIISGVRGIEVQEAVEILGINQQTLRGYIRNGEVKAEKIGNLYFIPKSEINKFFNDLEYIKKRYINSDDIYGMHSEIMEFLTSSSQVAAETLKLFSTWTRQKLSKSQGSIATKKMNLGNYITLANSLKENMRKEIWECNEAELDSLRSGLKFKTSRQILSRFYSYVQSRKKCKVNIDFKDQRINKEEDGKEKPKERYSYTEWIKLSDYLLDVESHIKNAKSNKRYAQNWLFAVLHLSLAWRSSDFLQIPSLPIEDILGCKVETYNFSEMTKTDAQKIINSLIRRCTPLVANKNGVAVHVVVVPKLLIATATALCVNEIHRKKEGKNTIFLYKNMDNSTVNKFFPKGLPEFKSRKANRTKLTLSYVTAVNKVGRGHLAYRLQGYSRSHKGKINRMPNQVTATYLILNDTIADAKSLGKHLFDRGIFGWQIDLMLQLLEDHKDDTLSTRTYRIKALNGEFTPLVVEGMASYLNNMSKQAEELVEELLKLEPTEIKDKLIKIANSKSPALLKHTQCIKEVKNCPYLEGKSKCLGCKYNVPTNYVLEIVNTRLNEVMTLLENTDPKDVVKRAKYTHLIKQLLFILMDFRRCSRDLGDDYITSFINIKELQDRVMLLEKTKFLALGGKNNGDKRSGC